MNKLISISTTLLFACSIGFAAEKTTKKTTSTSTDSSMSTSAPATTSTTDTTGATADVESENAAAATTYTDNTTSTTIEEKSIDENKDAGLFLEPALIAGESDNDVRSYGLGLRLGFHVNEIFFLGADGRYLRSRLDNATYGAADGAGWNLGPTLGFQAPRAGLRIWGTAILAGNYDPDAGLNGLNAKFNDPRGYRVGLGVRLASLSLNAEYEELDYDKVTIDNGTITGFDTDDRSYLLSLSFPVQL